MTAAHAPPDIPGALLQRALVDPFILLSDEEGPDPRTHVQDWFQLLIEQFPLWAFQPRSFSALHDSGLPTTHPLPTIVRSMLEDDGIDPEDQQLLDPLVAEIDRRRYGLLRGETGRWLQPLDEDDRLHPGWTLFLPSTPDLAFWEADTEHATGGLYSPYDQIGRELVALVEAREHATPGAERGAADEALDEFLRDLGVRVGRGQPSRGGPKTIRVELVKQGVALFTLCWDLVPQHPSQSTRDVLVANTVSDPQEIELWAAQLALPIFSRREIHVLAQQVREAKQLGSGAALPPTAEDFAVWVVARRLSVAATTLAKEALGTTASNRFDDAPHPFGDNA